MFFCFLILFKSNPKLSITEYFPYLSWQFFVIIITGTIATIGGFLDWRFHRKTLRMKLSKKERTVEAIALGLGGLPMFFLMWFAMISANPIEFLLPIILVLIFTVTAICYDEFIFHKKRCGNLENRYHQMLIFGNGIAWLAWFHFIYIK
ncbi:hypothetical protein EHQ30_06455 [Leptospira brenneri]|uniref:Uncharacterized protein n=2 Tax=Leptospira brenneri TaxID=2023182 RepID=A0A2M9Y740_9LEPT|nr:hypothetical protein CH361_00060 [Leptospira brenneri]TGK97196.1 hypothetical protein EHQ30_06455 [Leptospira brenneri]